MENKEEVPKENDRVMDFKPEKQRKPRFTTALSSKTALRGKCGPSGRGNVKGDVKKDPQPLESASEEQSDSSRQRKTKRQSASTPRRSNNAMSLESKWSDTDKQRLLIALQRFGVLEIDELIKAVPGKSEDDIRKFITYKWKMARMELRNKLKEKRPDNGPYLGPIDNWLDVLDSYFPNSDHYKSNPLAQAMLLIWKYEKHPEPSECGGIDFKALYEYMYYLLVGLPLKHLNQPTALYLQKTLRNFCSHIKTTETTEMLKFINGPLNINTQTRPPITEEQVISALSYTKEQCIDELIKEPGFNPLSIPKELLQKKAPEVIDETIEVSDGNTNQAKAPTVCNETGDEMVLIFS